MKWTSEQLAEALEHIEAIKRSMTAMQQMTEEMIADIKQMREATDRITGQVICTDAPSICPN
jgi:methyl-accepting chemotaxis protein